MNGTITFDKEAHRYAVDNNLVPVHVTGMLESFGISNYDNVPRYTLDRKNLIGTMVHEAIAFIDREKMSPDLALELVLGNHQEGCEEYEVRAEHVVCFLGAHKRFMADSGFKMNREMVEFRWVAEVQGMQYGMTIDAAGELLKLPIIIDYKCTFAKEKSWPIQLGGYRLGLPLPLGAARWQSANCWLKPDGAYELLPGGRQMTDRAQEKRDEEMFLSMLRISHWKLRELGKL